MAITVTARHGEAGLFDNAGTLSYTSSSFTPTADRLLVLALYHVGPNAATVAGTLSVSGGSLTWTRRTSRGLGPSLGYYGAHEIWTAPSGSSPSSMTLTISSAVTAGGDSHMAISVSEVAGYDETSPIAQSKTGAQASDGAETLTLDSAPDSTSVVIGSRGCSPNGGSTVNATPGAGWTELHDETTAGYTALQTQHRGSSTSTSVSWADSFSAAGGVFFGALAAIEIAAATTSYTLTAESGAFTLSGQDAALEATRTLGAEAGSLTLSGQAATLAAGRRVSAEAGSFALTGQDATPLVGRRVGADAGGFVLTGQDAALIAPSELQADAGAFALTGGDATLRVVRVASEPIVIDTHDGMTRDAEEASRRELREREQRERDVERAFEAVFGERKPTPAEAVERTPEIEAAVEPETNEAAVDEVRQEIARQIERLRRRRDDETVILLAAV